MQAVTTFAQLQTELKHPIELTCKKRIEDLESYPEANMRLTLTNIQGDGDDVMKLHVTYVKYDEYNKQFESHNYYDKDHQPVLNARDAGYYKVNDVLYVMASDDPNDFFTAMQSKAYIHWLTVRTEGETYLEWLESIAEQTIESVKNHSHR